MDNKPKQPPEPNYQDELDVYEAVLKLEEKYGKKFLTEEQREKLEKAGRTQIKDRFGLTEKVGGDILNKTDKYPILKNVIKSLLVGIEYEFKDLVPDDFFIKATAEEKGDMREWLFKMKYGVYPDYFAVKVALGGGMNDAA